MFTARAFSVLCRISSVIRKVLADAAAYVLLPPPIPVHNETTVRSCLPPPPLPPLQTLVCRFEKTRNTAVACINPDGPASASMKASIRTKKARYGRSTRCEDYSAWLSFSVHDTGVGIGPEDISK